MKGVVRVSVCVFNPAIPLSFQPFLSLFPESKSGDVHIRDPGWGIELMLQTMHDEG